MSTRLWNCSVCVFTRKRSVSRPSLRSKRSSSPLRKKGKAAFVSLDVKSTLRSLLLICSANGKGNWPDGFNGENLLYPLLSRYRQASVLPAVVSNLLAAPDRVDTAKSRTRLATAQAINPALIDGQGSQIGLFILTLKAASCGQSSGFTLRFLPGAFSVKGCPAAWSWA